MADSKVSDMTAATAVAAADKMYLVQSSASKSVTNAILFGNVATPTAFNDKLSIGDHDTITAIGAVSVDTNVTFINNILNTVSTFKTTGGHICDLKKYKKKKFNKTYDDLFKIIFKFLNKISKYIPHNKKELLQLTNKILTEIPSQTTIQNDYNITQLKITKKILNNYLNPNTRNFYTISNIK